MPPRTLNPELLRLLQGSAGLQGLPQAPQQIQAPSPLEQPNFAPPLQQQAPQQTQQAGQQPAEELGQKEMLENKFGQQYRALLSQQSTSAYNPYTTGIDLLKKGGVGGILGGLAALAGSPLGAGPSPARNAAGRASAHSLQPLPVPADTGSGGGNAPGRNRDSRRRPQPARRVHQDSFPGQQT